MEETWGEAGDEIEEPTSIELQDIKLFGKWDLSAIDIADISLTVSMLSF